MSGRSYQNGPFVCNGVRARQLLSFVHLLATENSAGSYGLNAQTHKAAHLITRPNVNMHSRTISGGN